MKVTVVGAGPSGLYLAILLKKADPAREVTVLERNAPDATFGWGVVFSEETLGALRDADYATYLEITDSFARWTSIDIHYRGQVLRSSGHTFSAIKRTHLLDILQRRARALGVTLRFGVEVAEAEPADLVVAADGSNSTLRRAGRVRHDRRAAGLQVRVVRHRSGARRVHVHLQGDRARAVPGARVPVRRVHEHVHRGDAAGDVAARRAGHDVRSRRASRSAGRSSPTSWARTG